MIPIINTILTHHPIRRRHEQKDAFIQTLQAAYPALQIEANGRSRNLVLGDALSAKLVLCAHYDTSAASLLPNIGMPYCPILKFLYSMVALLPIIALSVGAFLAAQALGADQRISLLLLLIVYYLLFAVKMFLLPPNTHNANDNTSGIAVLLETWEALDDAAREKVALVFFDNEEYGCVGSKAWFSAHKDALEHKPVLNFDCVGDGDNFLFSLPDGVEALETLMRETITADTQYQVIFDTRRHASSSSDHKRFPLGISVGAMHESRILKLYFGRIHTRRDTILNPENVAFLRERICRLIEKL